MRQIMAFIRIAEGGNFEKVTWYKDKAGNKSATKEPIVPTQAQLKEILASPYSETYC